METNGFFDNVLVQVVLILVIASVAHAVSGLLVHWLTHRIRPKKGEQATDLKKRQDTLQTVFSAMSRGAVWLIALVAIMRVFDFDISSIATGAGFLGIVVGLGAQATIRDYVAGFFILAENQYRVGDIVTLSGGSIGDNPYGIVEEISLRITKIRDLEGALSIVRNGEAAVVTNRTFDYSSVVLIIAVGYDSDIDKVERVVNQVGLDMKEDTEMGKEIIDPIKFLRVDNFAESSVSIKLLGKVKPAMQWQLAGEYRRRLLKALKDNDIEIQLPQVVVRDKKHDK